MYYASAKHARTYRNVTKGHRYPPRTLATLFLLTADRGLWRHWRRAVTKQGVDWEIKIPRPGFDPDACCLEKAALSLACRDHPQVTLHDLADCTAYPTQLILLVLRALLIARGEGKPP